MRDEFMIMRQGKQYVLFAGLLDEAHARGLKGIDTDLVQVPTPENGNVAVVKATVEMEDGRTFSGIGDASPDNVGRGIVPHIIRMAETRAKARALRDAVNVGATALEELSDGDDVPPAPAPSNYPQPRGLQSVPQSGGRERSGATAGEKPARPAPSNGKAAKKQDDGEEAPQKPARGGGSGASQKARKSQVDLLRTLAEELRGENGVARLEGRIGKSLSELTRAEADEWIDRLTPAEGRE
ncbi:MAG: hypothetical protein M3Q60_08735 [Actinomycetota bacterium]|nr:hypothetical protein [Actinomycetota bacterium]